MNQRDRSERTREVWLEVLQRYRRDFAGPAGERYWSPALETVSRDELRAIQDAKLAALTPFLYENSAFYRRRFERLGLTPDDISVVDDLAKWPVVDKTEMMADGAAAPPYGTYTTVSPAIWRERGWMLFSTSGSTGAPRVFPYTHIDREYWEWANARALRAMGIARQDTVFIVGGLGMHVWQWGMLYALARAGIAAIPGGGMDARARALVVERFKPTVMACTPSYALHLGAVTREMGIDPARSSLEVVCTAGEPGLAIANTRERIEDLWGCRLAEFYGCTEVSPHAGGYTCEASVPAHGPVSLHLMEDIQIWELVDADDHSQVAPGTRGLSVCTSLNSESSPQLRFLVGDYATFDEHACACGRTHVRAVGAFAGRADDVINIRGIKLLPSAIEQAIRSVPGIGDEFEIVLTTNSDGLDLLAVRVEYGAGDDARGVATAVGDEIRSQCEIRAGVEVLAPGTLPKTEFKARRVRDERSR